MKRVLLLATTTGYQTRMFGEAAERLGVRLVFATDRCDQLDDPWWDGAIPIRFHHEAASVEEIRRAIEARPIDGVLAVGDRPTVLAAHATRLASLPGHSPEAAEAARDKRLTRERMMNATGLHVPWFMSVSAASDPASLIGRVPFPCVIKPIVLSGSRGVIRANDAPAFVAAFERLRRLLGSTDVRAMQDEGASTIQIEEYIGGDEYAVEGVLERGMLRTLAMFDKPDPLDGPFFEETLYVTPSRLSEHAREAIVQAVARAADALGLWHGPIHAECRVNARGVFVLEVAARPIGGLCARALAFEHLVERINENESSYNTAQPASRGPFRRNGPCGNRAYTPRDGRRAGLEELLLRHAIGEALGEWQREPLSSGVMMIPIPRDGIYRGVEGAEEARHIDGVDEIVVTAKPHQRLVPLPEGASYLGFIFARKETPVGVEAALRAAHARLAFAIDPALPMADHVR